MPLACSRRHLGGSEPMHPGTTIQSVVSRLHSKRDLHKWIWKNHQHDSIDHFCFWWIISPDLSEMTNLAIAKPCAIENCHSFWPSDSRCRHSRSKPRFSDGASTLFATLGRRWHLPPAWWLKSRRLPRPRVLIRGLCAIGAALALPDILVAQCRPFALFGCIPIFAWTCLNFIAG